MPPALSVVIPVHNEPIWIGAVVEDLTTAVARSPFVEVELIIVDDGSDESTRAALADLQTPLSLRVLRQPNQGRFAARVAGLHAAAGDLVLLLDSRVSLRPDALAFVGAEMARTGPAPVWNGHVEHELRGNPFGRLWWVIESLAFRDYLAHPRTTSYGLAQFDRYPKGTGCFLAPRGLLLSAVSTFSSMYVSTRNANDDTSVIRAIAVNHPINISPGFACLYRPRTSLRPFVCHAHHRGVHFIDGYGRPGARFFAVIVAFYPTSALAVVLAAIRPRLLRALLGLPVAGAAAGLVLRRSRSEVLAIAAVGPIWVTAFGAGMWRGLLLAARGAVRRRVRAP